MMELARPWLLLLLPLPVLLAWLRLRREGDPAALRHPRSDLLAPAVGACGCACRGCCRWWRPWPSPC